MTGTRVAGRGGRGGGVGGWGGRRGGGVNVQLLQMSRSNMHLSYYNALKYVECRWRCMHTAKPACSQRTVQKTTVPRCAASSLDRPQ